MTIRQSTGLRNHLQQNGSFRSAFQGGKLSVYSGTQPATADTAPSGTLLVTITDASGAHTAEVRATGTITITGTSGTITGITIGGVQILGATVTWTTSNDVTAGLIRDQINKYHGHKIVTASAATNVVTLTAKLGYGTAINGMVVTTTESGGDIAGADVNIGSAVAGVLQVNGLNFDDVAVGLLAKRTGQTWSGLGLVDGVAGWFRLRGPIADNDSADSAGAFTRLDGNVAVSGGDMNASSTTLAAAATHTVSTFSPTEPANA
jgi:hypothetical protein